MTPPTTTQPPRTRSRRSADDEPRSRQGRTRIDPRISQRRTAVTREQGRKRLRIVMAGLIGTVLLAGAWAVLYHTPLFAARAITVTGETHETAAQIVQQAGLASHPALIDVNAAGVAQSIEQMPWVRSASVLVHWPDGVRIVVHEETPRLAMTEPGGKVAVLSTDGRVLEVLAASATPPGLITFGGPAAAGAAGSTLGTADDVGLDVASTLPPSFVAQVTGVTVEKGGWVQLSMTTPILIDVGTATELPQKYEDISSVLSGASLHNGDVIDVSVPDAVTVTPG
jgi:cell division septal protein FtsQ